MKRYAMFIDGEFIGQNPVGKLFEHVDLRPRVGLFPADSNAVTVDVTPAVNPYRTNSLVTLTAMAVSPTGKAFMIYGPPQNVSTVPPTGARPQTSVLGRAAKN